MKVSRNWLQKYFEQELPSGQDIADALTFHAFEIEEIEEMDTDTVLDVKVLPDRAAYALSHRGIASELSAVLRIPMRLDPLRATIPTWPEASKLKLGKSTDKCIRHMGALVKGVKVTESPAWLREALESVGQRSINNIVDATNYVTLNIGQPLHAFDAAKIQWEGDVLSIGVRETKGKETLIALSGETYELPEGTMVISEGENGIALDIAGVKGGMASAIESTTTDLFISVANFDGTSIRRTSQALKLWTDASLRFQNRPSPELVAYGMREILSLIQEIAGGEVLGVNDLYAKQEPNTPVQVTVAKINSVLGSSYTEADVTDVFDRLGFSYTKEGESLLITTPFERRDIVIAEDLVEEAGRILGYEKLISEDMPTEAQAFDQLRHHGIELIKDHLIEHGFTEISTQTFAVQGDIYLANPLDQSKPALRTTLVENMRDSLMRAAYVAPRVLGPAKEVKLFEIGNVFPKEGEHLSLVLGYKQITGKQSQTLLKEEIEMLKELMGVGADSVEADVAEFSLAKVALEKLGEGYEPKKITLGPYKPFSAYPFALRDIAVWTPAGTEEDEVSNNIIRESGDLLARIDLFDRFEKEGRVSYAFSLVFESFEKTLSDEILNPIMEKVTAALNANEGWEVR
jgi:phenylalanyl-tRNA synthetase beta chain